MSDDTRFWLRTLGFFPTGVGAVVLLLGFVYALNQWRYGGAVLSWALMWGLMLVGVGVVLQTIGRRWLTALGMVACGASALLVFLWERQASLGWAHEVYAGDVLGLAVGALALRARPISPSSPSPPARS
jgi:hypothetical protein